MIFSVPKNPNLDINTLFDIIQNNKNIQLSNEAEEAIVSCRNFLDKATHQNKVFYGINTGFGSLCNVIIPDSETAALQTNLMLSHACGTGEKVPQDIVRIMLLLKILSLSQGFSGVSLEVVQRLIFFYNHNIFPVVYQQGSLGASGDLAPLAHLCLPIIGYGDIVYENEIYNASFIEEKWNIQPLKLQSKEGLALLNGTQFMCAYAAFGLFQAIKIQSAADLIAAISIEAFDCKNEPFHEGIHRIRKQEGQIKCAENIRQILADSVTFKRVKNQTQDPYSFRCIPQVHGASRDTITHAKKVIENEINAVTDNPNIFYEEAEILSGGNFHGQPLALVLDFLAIALAEFANISERRTYLLISGQRNLPHFLTQNSGLHSGFMIPQYTAASIVSQNKQLCTPASVDSIVSSNGQEDHVSMGANAATKLYKVIENVFAVLGIELLNAAQALDFRDIDASAKIIQHLHQKYRKEVAHNNSDRFLHDDIQKSIRFVKQEIVF